MLEGTTIRTLQTALDGLMARQRATSDNIANVNTPYYTARQVSFEDSLRRAVETGQDPASAAVTTSYSNGPRSLTGNNVDLSAETVTATQTSLQYDLALRATSDQFSLVRTAARGA